MGVERADSRSGDEPMHRPCPRCSSDDTTFAYFNNGNRQQPRYRCKGCQRHWTVGGTLRTVPLGAAIRKKTKSKSLGAAATAATWSDSDHTGRADSQEPTDTDGDATPSRKGAGEVHSVPPVKNGRAKSNCTSHPSSPSHTSSGLKPPGHGHTTRAKTAPRKESSLESAVTSCAALTQATDKPLSNGFLHFPSSGTLLPPASLPSLGRLLASDDQQGYAFPPPASHFQHHKQQQAISDFVDHLDLKAEEDCEGSCGGSSLDAIIMGRHHQQPRQCSSTEQQPRLFHSRGVHALQEQSRPLLSFHSLPSLPHAAPAAGYMSSQASTEMLLQQQQEQQGGLHLSHQQHHQYHLQQQGSGSFPGQQAGHLNQISQMMHSQHLADSGIQVQQHTAAAVTGLGGSVTLASAGSGSSHLSNNLSRLSPNNPNPGFQFPHYVLPLNLASANPHSPRFQCGAEQPHQLYNNAHVSQPQFLNNGFALRQGDGRFGETGAAQSYGLSQEHQLQQHQQQQQQQQQAHLAAAQQNQLASQFQFGQNQHFQQQPYLNQQQHHPQQQQQQDQQLFMHYQQQHFQTQNHNGQQHQDDPHTTHQDPRQLQQELSMGYMLDILGGRGSSIDVSGGGGGPARSSNNPPAAGLFPALSQSLVMGDSGPMPDLIDSSLIPELPSGFMGGDLSLGGASISVL